MVNFNNFRLIQQTPHNQHYYCNNKLGKYDTSEINYIHHKNNLKMLNNQMYLVQGQIKHQSIEKKNITDQNYRKQNNKVKVILKSICQTLLYGI